VIFDVEVAFIYPVVAVFKDWVAQGNGLFALMEIAIFIAILTCGLAYVWAKGDLAWVKKVVIPHDAERPEAASRRVAGGKVYVAH
jgi:NADH-quinone oxidoreductase subunit A